MISQDAIQKILGIQEKVQLTALEMARQMKVTFYPENNKASPAVKSFADKFKKSLSELGVQVVPFESVWEEVPIKKRIKRFFKYTFNNCVWIFRKFLHLSEINFILSFDTILQLSSKFRIKKGICVICIGEQNTDELPMQYISSFKTNSIITILDFPKNIDESSEFSAHFNVSMSLFAYHMTNIVIAVDWSKWMVYNFNASHPIYPIDENKFNINILNSIIPKVVAPISPHTFSEFSILNSRFNINDSENRHVVKEMCEGAILFSKTGLYSEGKKIDDLPFRRNLHKLIGKLHLDNRSGMSFGFLAFQLPITISPVQLLQDFRKHYPSAFLESDYFVDQKGSIYILIEINDKIMIIKVPEVWVMTLRSGSNKTNFSPESDLLKLGLINGKMYMQFPEKLVVNRDYKPSFDTKVILSHAVGNAIIASVLKYLGTNRQFVDNIEKNGISISHWHGYFNEKLVPEGLSVYGRNNPHVSCSSPQSAIYALQGKLESFFDRISKSQTENYVGDIHTEPHHGINISFPSLVSLSNYILKHPESTKLGNKYL